MVRDLFEREIDVWPSKKKKKSDIWKSLVYILLKKKGSWETNTVKFNVSFQS